jgi:hypothetical protein
MLTTCGKNGYPTEDLAKRVAFRRSVALGQWLRVYFCSRCSCFHLTRQTKR